MSRKYDETWGAARTARYGAFLATPEAYAHERSREARAAVCASKVAYASQGLALRVRDKQVQRKPTIAAAEPYRCPHCRRWHLGRPSLALIAERAAEGLN